MTSFIGEAYRPEQNTSKETDERERDGRMLTPKMKVSLINCSRNIIIYLLFSWLLLMLGAINACLEKDRILSFKSTKYCDN